MRVVVLNDRETYSDIYGCVILDVPDDVSDEDVDVYVTENYLYGTPIA